MAWQPIETIPLNQRVLVFVEGKMIPGVQFGSAYHDSIKVIVRPEGCQGDWSNEITRWQPLPEPPQ